MTNLKEEWFDISVPIVNGMLHWPGDPPIIISRYEDIEKGGEVNLTHISCLTHIATHVDAPIHFFNDGKDAASIPLELLIGSVIVIEIKDLSITREVLEAENIPEYSRVLFKTKNSESEWYNESFKSKFIGLTPDAALYLREIKAIAVGIDYISISTEDNSAEVHKIILGAGIYIIEGLFMKDIKAGIYEMVCLPLKIIGADGAPARVILKKKTKSQFTE